MSSLAVNLLEIKRRMAAACDASGRRSCDVQLIAVSKTYPASAIQEIYNLGHQDLGENKQQEAEEKIPLLPADIKWHFIGALQRNKVRKVLARFHFIHSVDSLKLAEYINGVAGEMNEVPHIFLQINQAAEASKGGFSVTSLRDGWPQLRMLSHVKIIGLMCIPPPDSGDGNRAYFSELRELRDELASDDYPLPYLSMGMSDDFEAAIAEGATHIRVGSALFGAR